MPFWIYSPEALPNPEMMGKPRYTPDADYIRYAGVCLAPLKKDTWTKLPDYLTTIVHRDWTDRRGTEIEVPVRRIKPLVDNADRFAGRGVIMLDHEPSEKEKEILEKKSKELNIRFRKKAVEFFEQQRQGAIARQGTYEPSPYIDECYDILHMEKPYSVEALMAQRSPGAQAAVEIAEAIRGALKADREDAANAVARAIVNASPSNAGAAQKPAH